MKLNKNTKSNSNSSKPKTRKSNSSTSPSSANTAPVAPSSTSASSSTTTGYMHKFFNEQVRNFDWSLFQSSKPKSNSNDPTSEPNNFNSKQDPSSFTLFFSPIRNESKNKTVTNKWDHPFPSDHSIKDVKRWLASTKVFEDKIEELRKIGKHSFIILSYFTPQLPSLPYNAAKLGWAQIYSSPGWKTSNFVIKFPRNTSIS